jgi:cobalt transporter subunit CbtA
MALILQRILLTALIAGISSGLLLSAIQWIDVIPSLYEAETYENAGAAIAAHDHDQANGAHEHDGEAWAPDDGAERIGFTTLTNVLVAVGFALLLAAGFTLRGGVSIREGLLWGLGGFATFTLAPSLGLPPELPGAAAAGLAERQTWWLMTAALTALGLAAIAFVRNPWLRPLGLVLIALPHIIGAPQPEHHGGLAPTELADAFVVAVIVTSGLFWLALGGVSGWMFKKFA